MSPGQTMTLEESHQVQGYSPFKLGQGGLSEKFYPHERQMEVQQQQ
jgi:hypothetical protein